MRSPNLVAERGVFVKQLLDLLLVSLRLLVVGSQPSFEIVKLIVQLRDLVGRQPQVLLSISDLLAQVLVLLNQVLNLAPDRLVLAVVLFDALLVLGQLLEGLRLLSVGESDVLLCVSNFLGQTSVFLQ